MKKIIGRYGTDEIQIIIESEYPTSISVFVWGKWVTSSDPIGPYTLEKGQGQFR